MIDEKDIQEQVKHGAVFGSQCLFDENHYQRDVTFHANAQTPHSKSYSSLHSWIRNGKDDLNPLSLLDLYRKSSLHNSAINVKSSFICGGDFEFEVRDILHEKDEFGDYQIVRKDWTQAEINAIIEKAEMFVYNTGLMQYKKKAANQLPIFGGYYGISDYLNKKGKFTRNENGNIETTQLGRVWVEDCEKMRLSSDREFLNGEFKSVRHYLSNDFSNCYSTRPTDYKSLKAKIGRDRTLDRTLFAVIPADDYTPTGVKEFGVRSQYVGRLTPYRDYYGTADYEAGDVINYIEADYLKSVYDLKGLKSGFSVDYIIVKYRAKQASDSLENSLRKTELAELRANATGAEGERGLVVWAEPHLKDDGSIEYPKAYDIIPIPKDQNPNRYGELKKEIKTTILGAHKIITPEIVGQVSDAPVGFSNQSEMLITAQEILFEYVHQEYQSLLIQDIEGKMLANGIPVKVRIKKNLTNFRFATEQMLQMISTIDELRAMFDMKELEEGKETMAVEAMNRLTLKNKANGTM